MTLMGKINTLGGCAIPYPPGTTLFNGSNGATGIINLKKGCYYIRGQGGGGGGGDCGYYGTGGGGGSGAGFDGYIYCNHEILNVSISVGLAGQRKSWGGNTIVGDLMTLGGGGNGLTDNPVAGAGGTISIKQSLNIPSFSVKSNGIPGNQTGGANGTKGGANSVLTNTGAGIANAAFNERCAQAPGAGAAGGKQWDQAGGNGGCGELLIKYIKPKP